MEYSSVERSRSSYREKCLRPFGCHECLRPFGCHGNAEIHVYQVSPPCIA